MAADQSHVDLGERTVITSIVFTTVAAFFVGIRSVLRFVYLRNTGAEDYMILIALIFSIGFTVFCVAQKQHGLGRHVESLTPEQAKATLKFFWWSIISYKMALTFTKASFIMQYLRVFVDKGTRRACYVMLVIIICFGISNLICSIITCLPIAFFWDKSIKDGRCFNLTAYWFAWAAVNIVTDIAIFTLPIPKISSLQLPRRQKIALMVVFAIGGFVCITSILRLHSLYILSRSHDFTWYNVQPAIWTSVEVNVGIICACLPLLRPLLAHLVPNIFKSQSRSLPRSHPSYPSRPTRHKKIDSWNIKGHSPIQTLASGGRTPTTGELFMERGVQMGRLKMGRRPEVDARDSAPREGQIKITTVLDQEEETSTSRRSETDSEKALWEGPEMR